MKAKGFVECVPNFSFGDDPELLDALGRLVAGGGGYLLDASSDVDHDRSVLTWAARPERVVEVALPLVALAVERIDLSSGPGGVHPRIGACDVFPLIPLEGVERERCVELARALGERLATELSLPVYLYGDAAVVAAHRELPDVRRGGFEGLRELLLAPEPPAERLPDLGPRALHPTAGATAVGVRPFLIAFNVVLESDDLEVARAIARGVREASGGLPGVRALGFPLRSRGLVQVSVNIRDHQRTGLVTLFERVRELAAARGVAVLESELIGLAPAAALDEEVARRVLLREFDPTERVLERVLERLAGGA